MNIATFASFAEIGADFATLEDGGDPFLNPVFLEAAELHGAAARTLGWQPAHLAARGDDGALLGLMPLYRRSHSFGDFSRDYKACFGETPSDSLRRRGRESRAS